MTITELSLRKEILEALQEVDSKLKTLEDKRAELEREQAVWTKKKNELLVVAKHLGAVPKKKYRAERYSAEQVLAALKQILDDRVLSIPEILEELGKQNINMGYTGVQTHLVKFRNKGYLHNSKRGFWSARPFDAVTINSNKVEGENNALPTL